MQRAQLFRRAQASAHLLAEEQRCYAWVTLDHGGGYTVHTGDTLNGRPEGIVCYSVESWARSRSPSAAAKRAVY